MESQSWKKMIVGMMVILLGSGLIGCSSKNDGETNSTQTQTESTVNESSHDKNTGEEGKSEETASEKSTDKDGTAVADPITIGGTAISAVSYEAIKPHFEALGYTTEFVMFDSNPVVLEACNSGEVDMALGQHKKYVESFNENNGGKLGMAQPYGYYTGIGLYSSKYDTIDALPDGASIGIMNDAMNMDIALRILEENELIVIDSDVEVAMVADITGNPKNLKIIDMDQAQTVTALDDLDAACIFFTHMSNAGLDPSTYLARDSQMIKYPMGVIVQQTNLEADWAVDFAECFKLQNVRDEINGAFPGVFEFYENDQQAE